MECIRRQDCKLYDVRLRPNEMKLVKIVYDSYLDVPGRLRFVAVILVVISASVRCRANQETVNIISFALERPVTRPFSITAQFSKALKIYHSTTTNSHTTQD